MKNLTWKRKLRIATQVFRNEGMKIFWLTAFGAMKVYRRLLLIHRFLGEHTVQVSARIQVTVDLLRKNEMNEYFRFRPEADPSEIRGRLEAGQWCFIVKHQGDIVHASWAVTGRAWVDYLGVEIPLSPDEVYNYDSFTLPAFRGQNISPTRSLEMAKYFRKAGFRRIKATIVPENNQALWAAEKTGYRPFGMMGYVKIGPWRYNFYRKIITPKRVV
jgi:GNAT superfamily N-acetyltransferase